MTRPLLLMAAIGLGIGGAGAGVLMRRGALVYYGPRVTGIMLLVLGAILVTFALAYRSAAA